MSTTTDTRVAGLDAKLDWLSARIDSLEIGPVRPGRWCWRDARPGNVEALWKELTAWVDWLSTRYGVSTAWTSCSRPAGSVTARWWKSSRPCTPDGRPRMSTSTPEGSTPCPGTRPSAARSLAYGSGTARAAARTLIARTPRCCALSGRCRRPGRGRRDILGVPCDSATTRFPCYSCGGCHRVRRLVVRGRRQTGQQRHRCRAQRRPGRQRPPAPGRRLGQRSGHRVRGVAEQRDPAAVERRVRTSELENVMSEDGVHRGRLQYLPERRMPTREPAKHLGLLVHESGPLGHVAGANQ